MPDDRLIAELMKSEYPNDLNRIMSPEWEKTGRVHDWRNHVPDVVYEHWDELPLIAQVCVYVMAERAADAEEWD